MKKKKDDTTPLPKDELQKQLKRKNSALERLKRKLKITAEAQAREAQIQLALEKVRARTMAMQRSKELQDAASVLFQQVKELGIETWGTGFNIWEEDGLSLIDWMTGPDGSFVPPCRIPLDEFWLWSKSSDAKRRGEEFLEIRLEGDKLRESYEYLASLPDLKKVIEEAMLAGLKLPEHQVNNYVFFPQGSLLFITYEPRPEAHEIFKRFGKVFEQTYTRFLDLEKAEAQAREAQIEIALEKVRSQSLAMHNSNELEQVAGCLFDRLVELGLSFNGALIFIFEKEKRNIGLWIATAHLSAPIKIDLPHDKEIENNRIIKDLWNAIENGEHIINRSYSGEIKNDYFRYVAKYNESKIPESIRQLQIEKECWTAHFAAEKNSIIGFDTWSGHITKDEDFKILIRFAKVFEQAYTRFLDLQKAEAQAREAKIEAALERTRTQSMIMQHSKELDDTLRVFHEQVLLLGINSAFSFLWLPDEKNDRHIFWAAWEEGKNGSIVFKSKAINYPLDRNEPATAQCLLDWKSNEPVYSYHVPPAAVENYFAVWQELIDGVEQLKPEYFSGGLHYVEAFMKYGCFGVLVANDLTEDEKKILGRFAIEFERTYTRFLDLQKAEAQAREAQVEAALERVRARTMAMQRSTELAETAVLLFHQLMSLGVDLKGCGFNIWEKDEKVCTAWMSGPEGTLSPPFDLPLTEDPLFIRYYESRQNGEDFWVYETGREELVARYDYMRTLPVLGELLATDKEGAEIEIPSFVVDHVVNFSNGNLIFITYKRCPEAWDIFKRFGKVFEQTYTRFLDLQKAETQTREAKIQLALERVRARTMAMQNSNELPEAANLLFQQAQSLGMPAWSAGYCIWDEDKKAITLWMSSEGVLQPPFRAPLTEDPSFIHFREAHERDETFFVDEIGGEELVKHYKYMRTLPVVGEILDSIIEAGHPLPTFQIFHLAFFSQGFLLFITYEPVPEAHEIFKRFAKVFEQTYTRFLDLQSVEEQARESQIQLALERVRARTMAMQKSDELPDAALLLSTQVKELGVQLWSTSFQPWDNDRKAVTAWTALKDIMLEPIRIPATEDSLMINISEAAKKGELLYVEEMGGKVLENHLEYMNSLPGVKEEFGKIVDAGFSFPTFNIFHAAYFSTGFILFITEKPYPEAHDIFKRFAKVFEQTYTRFNDLKQAEAQAREAQIELGLERVRARAMAMQNSSELSQLVDTVFKELTKLDFALTWCIINIIDESSMSNTVWAANPDINKDPESYHMLFEDYPFHHAMMKGWKERKTKSVYILEGDEKRIYDEYLFSETEFERTPEAAQAASRAMEKYVVSFSFSNFGGLQTVGDAPLSDANLDILSRFGKVFDLTYTRFNDLKQAEAQARESQVQLALERVRARTMAMQRSDELVDTAVLLFQQIKDLGIHQWGNSFQLWEDDMKAVEAWTCTQGLEVKRFKIPTTEDPVMINIVNAAQKGEILYVEEMGGEVLEDHYKFMYSLPVFKEILDNLAAAGITPPKFQVMYATYFSYGYILFITHEPNPEAHDIFKRFGKVFEQTYTRFLDLQKAEAQTREAQIEAALERVRFHTMAMNNSDDVGIATIAMFSELEKLELKNIRVGIAIFRLNQIAEVWSFMKTEGGKAVRTSGTLDMNATLVWQRFYKGWQQKEDFFHYFLAGEEKKVYYKVLSNSPNYSLSGEMPELPDQHFQAYYFPEGAIWTYSLNLHSEEHKQILKKFTAVFSLTFRRYQDLKKAEAQARESQIQLALERVRARTMAMQKSDELSETVFILFQQFKQLGENPDQATIGIINEAEWVIEYWVTMYGNQTNRVYKFPIDEPTVTNRIYKAWKEQKKSLVIEISGKELYDFATFRESMGGAAYNEKEKKRVINVAFFSKGIINVQSNESRSAESISLLERFANVFEQTYTRFLDLKKAEAQAREAKIEAALEKVRSRTMAMQHSSELQDTALLLFQQVLALGVPQFGCGFNIWDDDKKAFTAWMGGGLGENTLVPPFKVSSSEDVFLLIQEAAERGESLFVKEQAGEELEAHYRFMNSMPVWKEIMEGITLPTFQVMHCTFFSQGFLIFISPGPIPEAHDIFKRFAKVFEQTYTRFLDLQNAEEQARESQIEAALERVRSKTMAMHSTNDVGDTVATMFDEFVRLGIQTNRCGILIFSGEAATEVWTAKSNPGEKATLIIGKLDMNVHPLLQGIHQAWKKKKSFYTYTLEGIDLRNYYQALNDLEYYPVRFDMNALPSKEFHSDFHFPEGLVFTFTAEPIPNEVSKVIKRFAAVFGQTYRRYLDLQKAEAQARESQIQLAMERVRARTMAMQHSSELADAAMLLFRQMQPLDIPAWSTGYCTWEDNKQAANFWMSSEGLLPTPFKIPLTEEPVFIRYREAYLQGEEFYAAEYSGEKLASMYAYMMNFPAVRNMWIRFSDEGTAPVFPTFQINHVAYFAQGFLLFVTHQHVPEAHDIFIRFGKVFEQTYTRFLDLQKAEAQAREAQIEAALEKVRSRSMGMQKSEELKEVIQVVYDQFVHLNIKIEHTGFVIDYKARDDYDIWIADPLGVPSQVTVPYFDSVYYNRFNEAKEKGEDFFATNLGFEEKNRFYQKLFEYVPGLPEEAKEFYFSCPGLAASTVLLDNVCLYIENFSGTPYSDEENATLMRFGKVFQQTYTRFLDLQKAEAQARESQVEAALERVRSRTMGMQRNEELAEVASLLFKQVGELSTTTYASGFNIWQPDEVSATAWMSMADGSMHLPFTINYTGDIYFKRISEARQSGKDFFVMESHGEELEQTYHYMFDDPEVKKRFDDSLDLGFALPTFQITHCVFFAQGYLMFISHEPCPEMWDIFKRFGKVFEQTYTRFLDLQKAEAQARESQIEAALERVRSRSMGMQKSEELREVIQVIFEQLIQLNFEISNAGFLMDYRENDDYNLWMADAFTEYPTKQHIPYFDHLFNNDYVESKEKGLELFTKIYSFEEKNTWVEQVVKYLPGMSDETKESLLGTPALAVSRVLMKNIALYLSNYAGTPYSEAENATLIRFAKVFEQTYIRFNDLKNAEAQALEAVKHASVDRVRAEIASMRTTNDLERIQPLIWNELKTLGVPFIRCGVFIMDDETQQVQTMLSTPDGKAIATLHVPFEFDLSIITNGVDHWRRKKMYKEHWDVPAFTKAWVKLSSLRETSMDSTQTEHPPENLYLHMLPFLQGMLYVGNDAPLNEDELQLVQNLADAFSTAYARYEDFTKLESANVKIEKTLVDLKQTQAQLVQSEKMASLGELTAGIAHEIQNPLNFVNNFSEVNTELIDEMVEEVDKGNTEEVKAIASDIKQNLEKINHHGRRADAIVKGMLQHSRSSNAIKEPTDINKLADEYLRLAYHGLRAKDKSFNATMNTDFDETIEKINIIPQDIGRVLLNLYNNAFYATNEKNKQHIEGYEPTVSISTSHSLPHGEGRGEVRISVKDNGNGIPQKVVDKIFQPFFTTKPTGQGTGLGLSLTYDIIKAHGGEIKVETKEGEGTTFIIQLPTL